MQFVRFRDYINHPPKENNKYSPSSFPEQNLQIFSGLCVALSPSFVSLVHRCYRHGTLMTWLHGRYLGREFPWIKWCSWHLQEFGWVFLWDQWVGQNYRGTPVSHPKMIIFNRKTHGCWVPPFLETSIYYTIVPWIHYGIWVGFWVLGVSSLFFLEGFDGLFQRKFEDLQLRVLSPCKHRRGELLGRQGNELW